MTWDGSGNFNRVYDWTDDLAAGAPTHFITASRMDTEMDGFATGLEACLARNGENAMTGVLTLNGNKIDFDTDDDTSISAANDDVLVFEIAGSNSAFMGHGTGNTIGFLSLDPPTMTATAATSFGTLRIGNTNEVTVPAGTTPVFASLYLEAPNSTATGTITVETTLYIDGPGSNGSGNYSLFVDSGVSRFDGVLYLADGAVGAPSFAATTDLDTGVYFSAVGHMSVAVAGTLTAEFDAGGLNMIAGSAAAPSLAGIADEDTGFAFPGSNVLIATTAGTLAWHITASQQVLVGGNLVATRGNAAGSLEVSHNSGTMETGTASGNADEFIIVGAASGANSGMTIISGVAQQGGIYFGDSGDTDIGKIVYDHSGNSFSITVNATQTMTINSAGNFGINETVPLAKLHVSGTGTSSSTVHADADELYIEGNANVGMTIASGGSSSGSIFFADAGGNAQGFIQYRHATDALYLGTATATAMLITSSGEVTQPLQPSFRAHLSTNPTDVTGNAAAYIYVFDTEDFDIGSNFDGTSTFTAPVTGKYTFGVGIRVQNIHSAADAFELKLVTSNRSYVLQKISNPANTVTPALAEDFTQVYSIPDVDMDASDTAYVLLTIWGMAGNTVDPVGSTGESWFAGHLQF